MKLNRWLVPVVLLCGAALLSQACKKKGDPEYKSLSGSINLTMPQYVLAGYTKTFMIDTLMTLSRSDGGKIGYYFTDPDTGKADTLVNASGEILHHTFTVTVPDKLATQVLRLTGFVGADDLYYSFTESCTYTIVRPGFSKETSITNYTVTDFPATDGRDGRKYYTVYLGKLEWMRQNLAWEGAGVPYKDCAAMTDIFGRYYTWEEAQTACPDGWRLPTDAEWTALSEGAEAGKDIPGLAGKVMADLYFNGTKMWEYWREVKITDELLLSAMPTGYGLKDGDGFGFDGLYSYASFWTSDEVDGKGVCRYIFHNKDIVYRGLLSKTDFAASVRCVRE